MTVTLTPEAQEQIGKFLEGHSGQGDSVWCVSLLPPESNMPPAVRRDTRRGDGYDPQQDLMELMHDTDPHGHGSDSVSVPGKVGHRADESLVLHVDDLQFHDGHFAVVVRGQQGLDHLVAVLPDWWSADQVVRGEPYADWASQRDLAARGVEAGLADDELAFPRGVILSFHPAPLPEEASAAQRVERLQLLFTDGLAPTGFAATRGPSGLVHVDVLGDRADVIEAARRHGMRLAHELDRWWGANVTMEPVSEQALLDPRLADLGVQVDGSGPASATVIVKDVAALEVLYAVEGWRVAHSLARLSGREGEQVADHSVSRAPAGFGAVAGVGAATAASASQAHAPTLPGHNHSYPAAACQRQPARVPTVQAR